MTIRLAIRTLATRTLATGGCVLTVAMLMPWSMGRGQRPEEAVETVTEAENLPRKAEQGAHDPQPLPPKIVVEGNVADCNVVEANAAETAPATRVLDHSTLTRPTRTIRRSRRPLEQRTKSASSERAYPGVQLNPRFTEAAIVSWVTPNSPAARSGLREGDRIWGNNNQRVESTDDLLLLMANLAPGEEIEIHFDRPHSLPVKLARKASSESAKTP
jgi:membrane-associated protease RseP (regulator of RpoE activity)